VIDYVPLSSLRHLISPLAQSKITARIEVDAAITIAIIARSILKLQPSFPAVLYGSSSSCEVDNHEYYHDDCGAVESDTCDITQRDIKEPPS